MESQVVLVGMEVTEVMQRLIWEEMHLEVMEAVEEMGGSWGVGTLGGAALLGGGAVNEKG